MAVMHPLLQMDGSPLLKDATRRSYALSTVVQRRGASVSRGKTRSYFNPRTENKTRENTTVNCNKINNRCNVLWLGLSIAYNPPLSSPAQKYKKQKRSPIFFQEPEALVS